MLISGKGIILGIKKIQESGLLIRCFTKKHGVIIGYYKIKLNHYIPYAGGIVLVDWQTKSNNQLGKYIRIEQDENCMLYEFFLKPRFAIALNSILCLYNHILKEHDIYQTLWDLLEDFIKYIKLTDNFFHYMKRYILLELKVLAECGFGLNFTKCAVSGVVDDLAYISPKSGSVVSKIVGEKYAKKLFVLHRFLITDQEANTADELIYTMKMIEFFIKKHMTEDILRARETLYNFLKLSQY